MSKINPIRLIATLGLAAIAPISCWLSEAEMTNHIKNAMGGQDILLSTPLSRPNGEAVKISIAKVLFQSNLALVIFISGYIFFIYLVPLSREREE